MRNLGKERRRCAKEGCETVLTRKQNSFCSRECAGTLRPSDTMKVCAVCGGDYKPRRNESQYEFQRRDTCSKVCGGRAAWVKRKEYTKRRTLDAMPPELLRHWACLNPGVYALARTLRIDPDTALDLALEAGVRFGSKNVTGPYHINNCLNAEKAYRKSKFNYRGRKIDQKV